MLDNNYVLNFIHTIIENSNEKKSIKVALASFYEYLQNTNAVDNDILGSVKKIMECLDEILLIKEKTGKIVIDTFFESQSIDNRLSNNFYRTYEEPVNRHYSHYHENHSSSSCGCGNYSYEKSRGGC